VLVAVPALWLAGRLARWLGTSLVVTSSRLVLRRGVLGRDVVQLRLQRVTEVHCVQSLVQRLLGTGRLIVEVAGDDGLVAVDDVRHPRALQHVLNAQLDEMGRGGYGPGPAEGRAIAASAAPPAAAWTPPPAGDSGWARSPVSRPLLHGGDPTPPHGTLVARSGPAGPRPGWAPGFGPPASAFECPVPSPASAFDPPAPAAPPSAAATGGPGAGSAGTAGGAPSIAEQLIQLDDLRRRGILTDDEFDAKKAELLSRL